MIRSVVRSSLPPEIKRSLDVCWKEGVAAQLMIGVFDYFLIPFALFLGAGTQEIGALIAVPNLLSCLAQLTAVRAVRWAGSRRNTLIFGIGLQALFLLPIPLLAFLPVPGKISALIVLVAVFRVIGSLIGPAWGSLVSDYLPEGQRGQYLGWRSRVVALSGIAGLVAWGGLLSAMKGKQAAAGFVCLFAAAAGFRFVSFHFITKMVDVPMKESREGEFTLWMFLRRFRESNFVKFIGYVSGVTFATQLVAPLLSVHMLNNLHFNYAAYTAVCLAAVISGLVSFPVWGRHIDRVGTASILKIGSLLLPIVPIFWVFARRPWHLIVAQVISGFIWSGFDLAATNFIYDAVSAPKRVRCLAYYNLINGAAGCAGAAAGGFLAGVLPPLLGYSMCTLFLISGVCRLAAHFFLSRHFSEVRASIEKASSIDLFLSVAGLRPLAGRNTELEVFPPLRPPRAPRPQEAPR